MRCPRLMANVLKRKSPRLLCLLFTLLLAFCIILSGCADSQLQEDNTDSPADSTSSVVTGSADQSIEKFSLEVVPEFSNVPYVTINGNVPFFKASEMTTTSFERYSQLDSLERCGVACASIGRDIMPTEKRGSIGSVKPSGWQIAKYDSVDGKYLYNRCHLLGYQLTGENANGKNLITGTRYMNTEGMLPFENMVADYVKETDNHVLYRVTPVFDDRDLVAKGVLMEAKSVEDNGAGILFCVFCYNNQPGITIDYATGKSSEGGSTVASSNKDSQQAKATYILNTNTKRFHLPSCASVKQMKEANKGKFMGKRDELVAQGYKACQECKP